MKCLPESEYYLTDYHEVYNGHFVALPTKKGQISNNKYIVSGGSRELLFINVLYAKRSKLSSFYCK